MATKQETTKRVSRATKSVLSGVTNTFNEKMPTPKNDPQVTLADVRDESGLDERAELANYLPGTLELVGEIGLDADNLDPLLKRLGFDAVKHHVAVARVLVRELDDLPDNPDEIPDVQIASLQSSVETEIKASKLTKKEKDALAKYEAQADRGLRQSAEALRAIREERLYREQFSSWDSYCTARWMFRGTSGDNKIAWLRVIELLESRVGKDVKLGVVQAKLLLKLWDHPDILVEALIAADEEAASQGRKRRDDDVRNEVERRLYYVRNEVVREMMSLIGDQNVCTVMERVREKEAEGLTFDEAVNAADEVIAARKKKSVQEQKSELDRDPQTNGDFVETEDVAPVTADQPATDVGQHLEDALDSLDKAFSGVWPDEDPDALDEIRILAEKCEDKLAEIIAKAKEALADADEPVAVSGVRELQHG